MRNNNRVTVGLWDYNLCWEDAETWERRRGRAVRAGCFIFSPRLWWWCLWCWLFCVGVRGEFCSTTWFDLVMRHWWDWGEIGQRSTNALQNGNVKYAVSSLSATNKKKEWSERKKRRGQGERYSCQVHMPVAAQLSWRTWIRRLKGVDWHRFQC